MPLIVLQHMHGENDAPLHVALLEALERRGLLDRYDFVVDPSLDLAYCTMLATRFPQVQLYLPEGALQRTVRRLSEMTGRGIRFATYFKPPCDAVCMSAGGGIHPSYTNGANLFWRFPRARRQAILFHSIERGVLAQSKTAASIAACDLVITRTSNSGDVAIAAGAKAQNVHVASDIVFSRTPVTLPDQSGIAAALRVDKASDNDDYLGRVVQILDFLEGQGCPLDLTPIEQPLDAVQLERRYGEGPLSHVRLLPREAIYSAFEAKRDAIISCRLHTTLLALLAGNRKILQFQIEPGTNKIVEILTDIGLTSMPILAKADVTVARVQSFLDAEPSLSANEISAAVATARSRNEVAFDRFEEWLLTLR